MQVVQPNAVHGGTGCHDDWVYAGREQLVSEYRLIVLGARGHGVDESAEDNHASAMCARHTGTARSPGSRALQSDRSENGWKHSAAHGDAATRTDRSHGCGQRNDVFSRAGAEN